MGDPVAHLPTCVGTGTVVGVEGIAVTIEASVRETTGEARILGHVDAVVREAFHRVLGAFATLSLPYPRGRPTLNFVPAALRKAGSGFDLPMALALAGASGAFPRPATTRLAALGEISLEGNVLASTGAVAMAIACRDVGRTRVLAAPRDAAWMALVPGVEAIGVHDLDEALRFLRGELKLAPALPAALRSETADVDFAEIRGHETPKRALLVAASGAHNVLLVGPPGSGKTALARRTRGILPPPSAEEALDILRIQTTLARPHVSPARPFRAPHHTSSAASIVGGGSDPRAGEVTLAHRGVLFLDELPEFGRDVREALREPLEEHVVTLGRAKCSVTMPADFVLIAAMNPCPCGWLGHPARACLCTPPARLRYATRISGPLLDRIDLQVEVPAQDPSVLATEADRAWSTAVLRAKVLAARDRQEARARRFGGPDRNGRLAGRSLERATRPTSRLLAALERIILARKLSGRARVRLLRVARTIADLAERDDLVPEDLLEAAELRGGERLLQGTALG